MPFLPNIIKSASQVRDLILILVTGAYALGFALWSVNAWREGLGWIPIANTQYFIAGFPILMVFFLLYLLLQTEHWIRSWASKISRPHRFLPWFFVATLIAGFLVIAVFFWAKFGPPRAVIGGEILVGVTIISLLILLMILFSAGIALQPANRGGLGIIIYISLFALTIGYFSILLIDQLYAQLPQEFGGFRPRRAVLHLQTQNLANSFRETLLRNAGQTSESVSDSIEVLVFYADHDRFIFKIAPDPQKITRGQLRSMPAHEIRSDAVVAATYLR
jgi:hypothetical protein